MKNVVWGLLILSGCPAGPSGGGAPTIDSVTLAPLEPRPTEDVSCSYTGFQAKEGAVDLSLLEWTVNDEVQVGAGTSLLGPFAAGDRVECTVTPVADGTFGVPVSASATVTPRSPGTNVLIVMADDLGWDKVGAYGVNENAPPTPNIDDLAAGGLRFDNAYTNPVCSPTRISLLTGQHTRRYDIGIMVNVIGFGPGLPNTAVTMAEVLPFSRDWTYESAAVGKWHVSSLDQGGAWAPYIQGFEWYAGSMGNLLRQGNVDFEEQDYFRWQKNTRGDLDWSEVYATTDTVDDALKRIDQMQEPWLLYLAFNAPHVPFHIPPDDLHTAELDPETVTNLQMYDAMVEAMDTEFGRLLDGIDPDVYDNTTVVFLGDNGTPESVVGEPYDEFHAKQSLYQGGVNVPFIVSGPLVSVGGTSTDALVMVTDLMPTVAEIAGVDLDDEGFEVDGVSFLHVLADPSAPADRDFVYAERFSPNGDFDRLFYDDRMIRDSQYKLVRFMDDPDELYDLLADPFEREDLMLAELTADQLAAWERLDAALAALTVRITP